MKKIVIAAALLLFCSLATMAQNLSAERSQELEMLSGIDAVRVMVKSEVKRSGHEMDELREAVEARLKSAGIKVLELNNSIRAIVVVSLSTVSKNSTVIRVQLQQMATLNRLDKIILAPTWERMVVGTSGKQNIQLSVSKLLDQFIADYLSVNRPVT